MPIRAGGRRAAAAAAAGTRGGSGRTFHAGSGGQARIWREGQQAAGGREEQEGERKSTAIPFSDGGVPCLRPLATRQAVAVPLPEQHAAGRSTSRSAP